MWRSPRAAFRMFARDQSAVASIEFAFVIYPFLGVILAIAQSFISQYYISSIDRATQKFAAELRSGVDVIKGQTAQSIIANKFCPNLPAGLDCNSVIIQLIDNSNCTAAADCWQSQYSNYAQAIRLAPVFPSSPVFQVGAAGDSQYLMVFYPLPAMAPIWDKQSVTQTYPCSDDGGYRTICVTPPIHGLLSTAMWINDPSVGVY